jgi:hypothetical protein
LNNISAWVNNSEHSSAKPAQQKQPLKLPETGTAGFVQQRKPANEQKYRLKHHKLTIRSHHINRCNFTQFCAIFSYSLQFLSNCRKAQFRKNNNQNPRNTHSGALHKKYVNRANSKIAFQNPSSTPVNKSLTQS